MHHCDENQKKWRGFMQGSKTHLDPFSLRISLIVKHKRKLRIMDSIDMVDTVIGYNLALDQLYLGNMYKENSTENDGVRKTQYFLDLKDF